MKGERPERRLAAILAADVAGYSRLMGEDEEGTLARLKAHRRELIDREIAEHHGRIVKTIGDGLLIEFPSVVEAVSCALAVQKAMAERNAGTPEKQRIAFRVGVNLSDISVEDGDIHGDGVTRLMPRSPISASRVLKISPRRCGSTAFSRNDRRRRSQPSRSPTNRRSRYCLSPI